MAKKITTLFLDIGGVLLTDGWGRDSRELAAEKFKLNLPEMELRHTLTFDTYELGKLTLDEYLDRTVFYEKRAFTKKEFRDFMFARSRPFPDMINFITTLKKKHNLKIAVVSNEGRELNAYRIKEFRLADFIDFFVSSCFVHFRKPDADIFKVALDIAHVNPEEVIYIEDRPMFVSIAESLGIKGIHHTNCESTITILKPFGLTL
ncbi:MAG: HAD family phosphatase [Bacteroidetes bacterium]|nr:HAD family phosphatase [Bacteroidota bacterium]